MTCGRCGYQRVVSADDTSDLGEPMLPTEQTHPDHREHAKLSKHVSEEDLDQRVQHERKLVDADRSSSDGEGGGE